jgi:hypothetical protein
MYIYTVYQTTNLINNKIYVGIHKTKNINYDYMGSGKLLKSAILSNIVIYFIKSIYRGLWPYKLNISMALPAKRVIYSVNPVICVRLNFIPVSIHF